MRSDDTVARIGGDEFVVLLANIADATQAALVGQKILILLKAPVRVGERELFVKGIGIPCTRGRDDFDSLLKKADAALYWAKEEGRDNCQLYALSLLMRPWRASRWKAELRRTTRRASGSRARWRPI
jgi:diguanylate cyclase (GGDEF)-like protein